MDCPPLLEGRIKADKIQRRQAAPIRDGVHSMMALQPGNLTPEKVQRLLDG